MKKVYAIVHSFDIGRLEDGLYIHDMALFSDKDIANKVVEQITEKLNKTCRKKVDGNTTLYFPEDGEVTWESYEIQERTVYETVKEYTEFTQKKENIPNSELPV